MYFLALALDYDGVIADGGVVNQATLAAIRRAKVSGRKLILVTGRTLRQVECVFPELDVFDRIIAENGALIHDPATKTQTHLAPDAPAALIERLRELKVDPLSVGNSIIATWHPHEARVLQAIQELGLEHQIIFNKGAVMALPPNVNKASGLAAALQSLNISPLNAVGVGDAENDHAFLQLCGCAIAVANALPSLQSEADLTTKNPNGAGVIEIIEKLLEDDLASVMRSSNRHSALLGNDDMGTAVYLSPQAGASLISGISGGGKSTLIASIIESIQERKAQFCIIDPEGDYDDIEGAVVIGDAKHQPRMDEALELLDKAGENVVVNLLAFDLPDRPVVLADLLPKLSRLRAETGRPHWLIIDEAHHMLPVSWERAALTLPQDFQGLLMVTVHPDQLPAEALSMVETLIAVGKEAEKVLDKFARAVGEMCPIIPGKSAQSGDAYVWRRKEGAQFIETRKPKQALKRHARKYAQGDVGDKSFYFRGSGKELKLRAQNLSIFMQIAEGVDDRTWLHHLRARDYSRWFRDAIKDEDLASETSAVEADENISASESRTRIKALIEKRYTGPATARR